MSGKDRDLSGSSTEIYIGVEKKDICPGRIAGYMSG